ncbi:MAG: DNA ligase-associated DEXH box helicase, partial [Saprospiraceae bacterium]
LQNSRSKIPREDELLIEQYDEKKIHHIFIFPFEGRQIHEGMAAVIAHRISRVVPITFSIAINDYGFELLSYQYVDMEQILAKTNLFSTDDLLEDIYASMNSTEMAKRKFREIAAIAGLIFPGYPGKNKKARQLQASSSLLFDVFFQYEQDNLFIRQSFQEVLDYQLDESRLRISLERISGQKIVVRKISKPSPLSFPLLVDRLREQLSSEKLNDRIQKMIAAYSDGD